MSEKVSFVNTGSHIEIENLGRMENSSVIYSTSF